MRTERRRVGFRAGAALAISMWALSEVFPSEVPGRAAEAESPPVDKTSVQDGVYTVEQARLGESIYEKQCVECHPPKEFAGVYMEGWSGRTAADLLNNIRDTMPENNPGGLKRQQYVDMVSYLFRVNGLPAGESKMIWKLLEEIQIDGPFGYAVDSAESTGRKPR